ncbi:hypothetical protein SAMN04489712_11759 [Thermomonospora echinospora]|uniref:Uncharacterized protein n=1 Tax=Thermomonospora echinospora TaxID=1992 RepID=A0A1H6DHT9_9ACTN|nr:hypothetical protein SAMN04489712_11759 [Thermomonospora echinospora]
MEEQPHSRPLFNASAVPRHRTGQPETVRRTTAPAGSANTTSAGVKVENRISSSRPRSGERPQPLQLIIGEQPSRHPPSRSCPCINGTNRGTPITDRPENPYRRRSGISVVVPSRTTDTPGGGEVPADRWSVQAGERGAGNSSTQGSPRSTATPGRAGTGAQGALVMRHLVGVAQSLERVSGMPCGRPPNTTGTGWTSLTGSQGRLQIHPAGLHDQRRRIRDVLERHPASHAAGPGRPCDRANRGE